MSLISRISDWLDSLFRASPIQQRGPVQQHHQPREPEVPVLFSRISVVDAPPRNDQVVAGQIYCVVSANKPKWSLFRCPCGCRDVITLSLQSGHKPHWRITHSDSGRPTLYPSVWRDKGCLSHFWLKDGRIFWCPDTGTHPDLRPLR